MQLTIAVAVASAAHTESNYRADGYSSVDDVYEGQHKSSVSLGLGTGVTAAVTYSLHSEGIESHSSYGNPWYKVAHVNTIKCLLQLP